MVIASRIMNHIVAMYKCECVPCSNLFILYTFHKGEPQLCAILLVFTSIRFFNQQKRQSKTTCFWPSHLQLVTTEHQSSGVDIYISDLIIIVIIVD